MKIIALCLLLHTTTVLAEVYRVYDSDGMIHYRSTLTDPLPYPTHNYKYSYRGQRSYTDEMIDNNVRDYMNYNRSNRYESYENCEHDDD